jgi:DNA-binding transcriptional LysR family regulator
MDIHHLRVFASVYKNRSFSKASGELHLTQPTISEHVKGLEEELRCKLFDRVGRRIIPTKEADLLYVRAVEMIDKMKEIKADMGLIKGEISGLVKVGASYTPGAYIIPSLAAQFREKHPDVSFQLVIENSKKITEMVADSELLLGIISEDTGRTSLEYEPLMEDELVLISPPGLVEKSVISVRDLAGLPFLMREEGSGPHKSMMRHHAERGVHMRGMNVVGVMGSSDSILEAVKTGLGVSMLSRLAVQEDVEAGRVKEVKLKGVSMKRNIFIIVHRNRTLPGQYMAFLDYLKDSRPL